ncbi:FxsA family protein [Actinophytocola sp.]|uniref:FxsA family protein n=1 Tax=Actinophytocola sp. TaxID=1872138 RepID=UPI002D7E6B32|nr:FxsA family protein [Actinophytocola sp.]HET9142816.1 FxsA family protein [Actinophytocola sp.]
MPVLLFLLIAAIAEITVLVLVGQAIGFLPTVLLLILASLAGMWLLRREGARTLVSYQQAVRSGRVPAKEMIDGVLLAAAGVLVIAPGFISDVLALALLFPPTRGLVSRRLTAAAERRARSARHGGAIVVDSTIVVDSVVDTAPEPNPDRPALEDR